MNHIWFHTLIDFFSFRIVNVLVWTHISLSIYIYIEREGEFHLWIKINLWTCEPNPKRRFHWLNQWNWLMKLFNMMKLYYIIHFLWNGFIFRCFLRKNQKVSHTFPFIWNCFIYSYEIFPFIWKVSHIFSFIWKVYWKKGYIGI